MSGKFSVLPMRVDMRVAAWIILVRGGTYSKFRIEAARKYLVNVGSVGEPRDDDSRAAYAICDLSEGSIELRRVSYDIAKTEAKLQTAGLPRRRVIHG